MEGGLEFRRSSEGSKQAKALTFVFVSKRPLGVSIIIDGARNGYSAGSKMRR